MTDRQLLTQVEERALSELANDTVLMGTQRAIVLAVAVQHYHGLGVELLRSIAGVSTSTLYVHLRILESAHYVRWERDRHRVTPGPRIEKLREAVAR